MDIKRKEVRILWEVTYNKEETRTYEDCIDPKNKDELLLLAERIEKIKTLTEELSELTDGMWSDYPELMDGVEWQDVPTFREGFWAVMDKAMGCKGEKEGEEYYG